MKPVAFEYVAPRTLDESLEHLAAYGDDAKLLAGGQSLVPMMNLRLARPSVVVDVNRVVALADITEGDGQVRLGALVRQRALERWAAGRVPLLAAALRHVGHTAIRARGTVAGSIAHADPAAELPALFVALDGVALVRSRASERLIPASDLFLGPLTTCLRSDEMVVETRWTLPPAGTGWGFHEVSRRQGDFAMVGVVASLRLAGDRIVAPRVTLFGVGPTPVRASDAEKTLTGAAPDPARIGEAARVAAAALDPPSDIHAPARYRTLVAATLTERALTDALGRAVPA